MGGREALQSQPAEDPDLLEPRALSLGPLPLEDSQGWGFVGGGKNKFFLPTAPFDSFYPSGTWGGFLSGKPRTETCFVDLQSASGRGSGATAHLNDRSSLPLPRTPSRKTASFLAHGGEEGAESPKRAENPLDGEGAHLGCWRDSCFFLPSLKNQPFPTECAPNVVRTTIPARSGGILGFVVRAHLENTGGPQKCQ